MGLFAQSPEEDEVARLLRQGGKGDGVIKKDISNEAEDASSSQRFRIREVFREEERRRREAEARRRASWDNPVTVFVNGASNAYVRIVNVGAFDKPSEIYTRESPGLLAKENWKELSKGSRFTIIQPGMDGKVAGKYRLITAYSETHLFSATDHYGGEGTFTINSGTTKVFITLGSNGYVTTRQE